MCPVKESGEHHDCAYEEEHSEDAFLRINVARVSQHKHKVHFSHWGMDSLQMVSIAPRDIELAENTARLMSVTVGDNRLVEEEDNNSTFENILDDDAIYDQSDFEESDIESEAETDLRSTTPDLGSYGNSLQQLDPNMRSAISALEDYSSSMQHQRFNTTVQCSSSMQHQRLDTAFRCSSPMQHQN